MMTGAVLWGRADCCPNCEQDRRGHVRPVLWDISSAEKFGKNVRLWLLAELTTLPEDFRSTPRKQTLEF